MMSICFLILVCVTDFQEITRPPLQLVVAQLDDLPNTLHSYFFYRMAQEQPTLHCVVSWLSLETAGTLASSTQSLFSLASPDKITPWSGATLGSF